jgi:hypothetical protein
MRNGPLPNTTQQKSSRSYQLMRKPVVQLQPA